jgi:hypothetical protein
VPTFLEEPKQHDRDEAADMQTVCSAIIADIGDKPSGGQPLVERRLIGALVDETALARSRQKRGMGCRHGFVI